MRVWWVAAVVMLFLPAQLMLALEPDKKLEQYVRATWTVDRGLPQSTVLGVTQTEDGYLWIATQEGFVRFDGVDFKTYDNNSHPQITSKLAVAIRGARDGSLYVGTMGGGLIRLRGEQIDSFTEANGLPSNLVTVLHETEDGTLWIGTTAGLARLSGDEIVQFPREKLPHPTITAVAVDATGRLWIATQGGLASVVGGEVTRHTAADGFPARDVLSLHSTRNGTIWIGSAEGLFRYQGGTVSRHKDDVLGTTPIQSLYEDDNGSLWVGTFSRGFARVRHDRVEFDAEKSGAVSTFFEDDEGNLWIGRVGGLTRLADGLVVAYSKAEGLADDDIKTVTAAPDGTIWVGSRLGVETVKGDRRLTAADGLSSAYVLSARAASDGSLWVGTADRGLNRVHDGRITTYRAADGLPDEAVLALYEDRRGAIWVGTSGGLTRIVNGTIAAEGLPPSLAGESISTIHEARDGSMWIGTHEHGIARIGHGNTTESLNTDKGLSTNFVVAIHQDSTGTHWIGTAGGGLNRYKDGRFVAITTKQGLQDDSVFAILEDRRGNLWMSSNKGIFRARLDDLNAVADGRQTTFHSVIYGRTDGMRSRECNGGVQPVATRAPNGTMWFATTGGVAMIDPEKALVSEPVPAVLIGDIFVDRTKIQPGATIPPGHRTLEIHYTSPTFKTPDKLRFQYRLFGSGEEWTDVGERRVAYYTNVAPGSYRFDVRAINGEGVVTPASSVSFTVQPFFYQTAVFWALAALLVLAAAWTAHQYRIRIIRQSAERFKLLFDRNLAGVYRAHADGRILDCNQACLRILGLASVDELAQQSIFDSYANRGEADELIRRLRQEGAVSGLETELRRSDGTPLWVLQNVSLAKGPQGQEILEATLIDITDRKRAEERIRYQAYHDALTDLPNRALFKERLALALAYSERRGRQAAVLFLDLDRFKLINDTLGHTVGDHLLQGMAERLKACVREEDSVARVGGDEFTVLLMDLAKPADATVVARKILEVVARPIHVDGHELFVTCSIGISMSPTDGADAETLLKNADNALYRAKESGKNTYELCTPSMTQLAAERLALESSLRQAVERNEFIVLYQPQYDLRTRNVVAVEALVRWNRPGIGVVGPSEFITAAEESRLIVPIGDFVLHTAAKQAQSWNGRTPVRVAVNVSAAQFQQRALVRTIRDTLARYSIDPTRLEVEITESTAMQNPEATADILHELKDLGVSIVIDDFGIGHSSLNYLKRFPIDGLKIDKTFVEDMMTDASDAGIVAAVIAMAHALKLRVTAEGVETDDQLAFLAAHGCFSIQGYLLSHPVPAEAITTMLRSGTALSTRALPHTA